MDRAELDPALTLVVERVRTHLASLDAAPVHGEGFEEAAWAFGGPLPDEGNGALATLERLSGPGLEAAVASAGPRNFHFVTGGVTPAALGADWLASALDQNSFAWIESPLASQLERVALGWLRELFGLPADWGGVLTTGATQANLTALSAGRRWWGERHGVDVDAEGLPGLPPVPVFAGGYVHSTAVKALGMLGIGRSSVRILTRDPVGRIDVEAVDAALTELGGAPALILATAGEVNAGDFDPIPELADLAEKHNAWLHVDGAFGLFARVSPEHAPLAEGVDRADAVIADGHKWLNVPYDCGFAFVKRRELLFPVFNATAAYLPDEDPDRPNFGFLGPESSRRARSLAVWATLDAYGRRGYRELVERNCAQARLCAELVDAAPDLERLADVPLNIVCFRLKPPGVAEEDLDDLNTRAGEALLAQGTVYAGTTRYGGTVAFRPAFVNWRTRDDDVRLLIETIRALAPQ